MRQRLLTRRGIGLTIAALLVAVVCLRLGWWQLDRARPEEALPTTGSATTLATLVQPGAALDGRLVGRLVTATGRYLPDQDRMVRARPSESGGQGVWVLSALRTDTGATLPVVRGWASQADASAAPPPPTGRVTVEGVLQPPDTPVDNVVNAVPTRWSPLTSVTPAELVGLYPSAPIYDAYVLLSPASPGLKAVAPLATRRGTWNVLNAVYALQWWAFAGFAAFMWFRILREENW